MVEELQSTSISKVDSQTTQEQWQAWEEIERLAQVRETDKYYLPKALIMTIASYLNNYELAKLDGCSSYLRYCTEGQY